MGLAKGLVAMVGALVRACGALLGGGIRATACVGAAAYGAHLRSERQREEAWLQAAPAPLLFGPGGELRPPPPGWTHWLYTAGAPWSQLSGEAFEQALAVMFVSLGYGVARTPLTGDMGVDLVLTDASGCRIAVQAKGYASGGSVGFDAVKEVHTGACILRCHRAAVITNSRFTKNAHVATSELRATGYSIALFAARDLHRLAAGEVAL